MDRASSTVAVVSTLISSLALIGVVIGLILQTRQLGMLRRQAVRASHAELVRLGMEFPNAWVDPADTPMFADPESYRRAVMLNWQVNHLQLAFVTGQLSELGVRDNFDRLFVSKFRRDWWSVARRGYVADAKSKADRKFIALVDEEYQRAMDRELAQMAVNKNTERSAMED